MVLILKKGPGQGGAVRAPATGTSRGPAVGSSPEREEQPAAVALDRAFRSDGARMTGWKLYERICSRKGVGLTTDNVREYVEAGLGRAFPLRVS
jgi:hypothetical protein